MKIYEIGTGYTPIPAQMGAATEIVVEELTKSLIAMGKPVKILDISSDRRAAHNLPITEVKVPQFFTKNDVSLGLAHKLKRVAYSVSLAFYLGNLLRKEKESVVLHFHNQYNLFFFFKLVPARIRKKARIAYTVHSYIWHGAWETIQADVSRRYFQECFCIQHADCVFVLNEQTKQNICRNLGADEQKIHLINNGVNTDTYRPLSNEEILSIKSARALNGKRILVQVGSVCDRKNQLGAVQLLKEMLQSNPNLVFCYAGGIIDGEYQAALNRFAAENGIAKQVIYLGELEPGSTLNEVYNMADAMIFPSKAEGFSLVIIEAMAAGIPVFIYEDLQFRLADHCLRFDGPDTFVRLLKDHVLSIEKNTCTTEAIRLPILQNYTWASIAREYLAIWQNQP